MLAGTNTIGRALLFSAATVLVGGGCTSTTAGDLNAPHPSRAVVSWVGGVCSATQLLQDDSLLPTGSEPAEEQERGLKHHLRQTPQRVREGSLELKTLSPSVVHGGDEFIAAYLRALAALKPELSRLTGGLESLSLEATREHVRQTRALLASLDPEGPDLLTLMAGDPVLARAYELALACDPATQPPTGPDPTSNEPPPTAADGSNVSACVDGNCEVSVTSPAKFVAGPISVSVTDVFGDGLHLTLVDQTQDGRTEMVTGVGNFASLNDVGIRVIAISGDTALLRIVESGL